VHPTLARQLRRLGLHAERLPSDAAAWGELLARVDRSYQEADDSLAALDRTMELSSLEMGSLQRRLADERDQLSRQSALLGLLQAVTVAANEAVGVEQALGRALDLVGTHLDWPLGHAWLPDPAAPGSWRPSPPWRLADPDLAPYRDQVTGGKDARDELVELVVADARPHRLPGPDARNPRLPRAAARVGATVAFAFPVLLGTEVVAVLELFGPTPAAAPDDLLEVSAHIGTQLGRVVERSRASSALRRAEERFRTIFQVAGSGMLQLDHDGRIVQANRAIQEIVGRSPAQLVGRHLVELYDPEDAPAALAGFSALARGERDRDRLEVRYPRPDGSQGWLDVCTTALRDGQGRMRWAIVVAEETTQRKQVELEVRLGQKLEAVGRLAAGIAHEINTPVQFVGDNLRFLENAFADLRTLQLDYQRTVAASADRLGPATVEELRAAEAAADLGFLEEEVPGAIDQALAGVDRIATIVRAMKSFAHPPQRQRAAADLNQALRDTVMVARNQLEDVAEVELDLGDLPPVVCQLGDLNQVFLNLLMNAVDAVAETGRIGHITVRTRHLDDEVEVRIEDTGGGIPEAVRERVFDPFFTTKEVGRGTGQGLALAHAIVRDKHGGTLDFETEVGRGTAFTIRLPVAGGEHAGRTTARN